MMGMAGRQTGGVKEGGKTRRREGWVERGCSLPESPHSLAPRPAGLRGPATAAGQTGQGLPAIPTPGTSSMARSRRAGSREQGARTPVALRGLSFHLRPVTGQQPAWHRPVTVTVTARQHQLPHPGKKTSPHPVNMHSITTVPMQGFYCFCNRRRGNKMDPNALFNYPTHTKKNNSAARQTCLLCGPAKDRTCDWLGTGVRRLPLAWVTEDLPRSQPAPCRPRAA